MGKQKSALAKITRPLLRRYFPRERVYRLLDELSAYPMVCVTGPAGSGKTTLVNSYVKERGLRCLWYRADGGDHDPATFFYYLREAAAAFSPGTRKILPLFTPEYQSGIKYFALRWFEDLFSRMATRSVLVIDNYNEVPERSPLHTVLAEGISTVPPGTQVILVSRRDPAPEFSRLKADNRLASIGWKELRLEPEETGGIVGLVAPRPIPEKRIRSLHDLTDGWAAGVVIMAQKEDTGDVEPGTILEQDPDDLFSYFASEVFDGQKPGIQDFLIRTAFLPAMSIPMAEGLTGSGDAREILTELSRYNLFTERWFHTDAVYSYHPLFRHFLLTRAHERYTGEELRALSIEAATLLEENGQVEEALNLVQKAGSWDAMSRIILLQAKPMLNQGRHRTLENWILRLPPDVRESSPWLRFCLGTSRLPLDPVSSMKLFEGAYAQFKQENDVTGFFLAWAGLANAITFGGKVGIPHEVLINDLDERMQELDAVMSVGMRSMVVTALFTNLVLLHPARVASEGWDAKALELARKSGNIDVIILTFIFHIYYHVSMCSLREAAEDIESLNQFARVAPMQEWRRIAVLLANCLYDAYAGAHEECLSCAEKALEISERIGIHLWDVPILRLAAMSCQNAGEYERASLYLYRLVKRADEPAPREQSFAFAVRARQAMAQGRIREAFALTEQALQLAYESQMPVHMGFILCHKAWVSTVMGEGDSAQELFPAIERFIMKTGCRFITMNLSFVRAMLAFDRGEDDVGLGFLKQGLGECRKIEGYPGLPDHPPTMTYLLSRALEAGIEEETAREIIRRRRMTPPEHMLGLEHWPWPVKIHTLGRFEIVRDGRRLTFPKKAQKKPLEMLACLISHGCFEVSEDLVADMLWPSADGDMALRACTTTLHRLRKMLGGNELIVRKNGLLSLDPRQCWVDARAFLSLLDRAEELRQGGEDLRTRMRAEEDSRRALSLYRGRFLPGDAVCAAAVSLAEELHERYFMELSSMSSLLMEKHQWGEAADLLELGLAIDPCSEGCCSRLMACLDAVGKRHDALDVYDRFRHTLSARQGIRPTDETEELARKIRRRKGQV